MILGKRNIYIYDTFCIWYFVCKTMGFWCFNSGWRVQTRNGATEIDRCFPCSNLLKTTIPKMHIWSARSPSIRKRAHLQSTFYTWSNNKARELELPKPLYCISVRCHKNYKENQKFCLNDLPNKASEKRKKKCFLFFSPSLTNAFDPKASVDCKSL